MVMSKVTYEELRQQRMEENKKKLEQLHLPLLSQSLQRAASSPKTSPVCILYPFLKFPPLFCYFFLFFLLVDWKNNTRTPNGTNYQELILVLPLSLLLLLFLLGPISKMKKISKPRTSRTELVPVRRSGRFSNKPTPDYKEVSFFERLELPRTRRIVYPRRDLSNRVYASDEARAWAIEEAEKLEATLEGDHLSFVKPMLQSHVTGGFWLGLPSHFCKKHLPKGDATVTLVDEEGDEWPTIYLARKTGLSGGWRKFSLDHDLADGDALVFQLVQPTVFKVYIIRESGFAEET